MESKKFLTAEEVAAEFGLEAAELNQFVESGELRALADRGIWKYRRDELQGLVDAGKIHSAPSSGHLPSFDSPDDDVEYIELDEEALAEQADLTFIPEATAEEAEEAGQDWFVPSDNAEMSSPVSMPEQSSSDVAIYSGPAHSDPEVPEQVPSIASGSDSDVVLVPGAKTADSVASDDAGTHLIGTDSDSDVRIAAEDEYQAPKPEDSGIVLDFNFDAGATVSSSGSSLRLPKTADEPVSQEEAVSQDEVSEWDEPVEAAEAGGSSVVGIAAGGSSIDWSGQPASSSIDFADDSDSDVKLVDVTGSDVKLRAEESGIMLDEGSHLGMSPGSSVARSKVTDESGISLESIADSGITLDDIKGIAEDSGISLFDRDSGIGLSSLSGLDSGISLGGGDSGISLEGGDSGLSFQRGDSGLSLESGGDSGIAIDGNSKTMADDDLAMTLFEDGNGPTQSLDLTSELDHDSSFDMNLDDDVGATSELLLGDEDDVDEISATVVQKGRKPQAKGGLSGAFDLDEPAEVEDLEISEDLDAGVDDEVEEFEEHDAVLDASDDTFGTTESVEEDDEYLEPVAKKATGPREPAWGVGMAVGLVICTLVLTANVLVLWAGISTMWNGSDAQGPAASLIESLGGMI